MTQDLPLESYVASCTVRIEGDGTWGTGWFIAQDRILTAAHVMRSVAPSGGPFTVVAIEKRFTVTTDQVYIFPDDDIAVIDGRFDSRTFLALDADLRLGEQLYAYGYTAEFTEGDSVTVYYEGPTKEREPLLKLKGGQVEPGMSGAAVVNTRTGGVCGLLISTRDRRLPTGGRAVPVGTIESVLRTVAHRLAPGLEVTENQESVMDLLCSRLRIVCDEIAARRVAGSERLRISDLVDSADLLMPFNLAADANLDPDADLPDLIAAWAASQSQQSRRVLALAPPGYGKSTLATVLFLRLAQQVIDGRINLVPILIDLRDYRAELYSPHFGSRAWVSDRLADLVGRPVSPSFRFNGEQGTAESINTAIILDSVDEFLASKLQPEINSLLSSFLVQRADLVCCRTQFYERFIAREQISYHDTTRLLPATDQSVVAYVRAYYRYFLGAERGTRSADDFLAVLRASPNLAALCSVPLRLNMALDIFLAKSSDLSAVNGILPLYHGYVSGLLRREAARAGSVLPAEEKLSLLEKLAFEFYDERSLGTNEEAQLTIDEFYRTIRDYHPRRDDLSAEQIAEDLRSHSLLYIDGASFSQFEPGTLRFVHKSFQEYLVASYVFHSMLASPQACIRAFQSYFTVEIGEFLKEYLQGADRRMRGIVGANGLAAYELSSHDPRAPESKQARDRTRRSVLGYYLGNLGLPEIRAALREKLLIEPDRWIRRSLTIGLGIGGEPSVIDNYVEVLACERDGPGPYPENDVNNGFNLTYFGDQPFDLLHPEIDRGGPRCAKTISWLIYSLQAESDRGSWRLDLYSILDIWYHRQPSQEECEVVLRDNLPVLTRLYGYLSSLPEFRHWPEVRRLADLINKLRLPARGTSGIG
jgi:hypothetical protein